MGWFQFGLVWFVQLIFFGFRLTKSKSNRIEYFLNILIGLIDFFYSLNFF